MFRFHELKRGVGIENFPTRDLIDSKHYIINAEHAATKIVIYE